MDYPIWDIAMGGGVLMGIVAITHVIVSHFAIGGGLLIAVTETLSVKRNDPEMRDLAKRSSFVLILFSWVLFRTENLSLAVSYIAAMFGLAETTAASALLSAEIYTLHNLVLMALCAFVVSRKMQSWDFAEEISWVKLPTLATLLLVAIAAMFTQAFNPFLYFQF